MAALLFKDYFWDSDFTGRSGYDALIQRLNDGRQMCKDVEELITMRALAEERYGKELVTIAHRARGHREISSLRDSFDQLKAQIENIGNVHIQLSSMLREEVKKVEIFRERQKDQKKKFEGIIEKVLKIKGSCFKKTMESKKNYKQRCREVHEAEQALRSTTTSSPPKHMEKVQHKVKQCRQAANEAEKLYVNNVEQLERVRKDWVDTNRSTCEVFQQMEGDRISALRCALWDHCNHFSMQCVKDDEIYEDVRRVLENCDITTDNNSFIKMKTTDTSPPEPVVFENYYGTRDSPAEGRGRTWSVGKGVVNRFSALLQGSHMGSNTSLNNSYPSSAMTSSHSLDAIDAAASGSQDVTSQDPIAVDEESYVVNYDYLAQSAEELSIATADVVQVLEQGEDGWWTVRRAGMVGLVPGNYLSRI